MEIKLSLWNWPNCETISNISYPIVHFISSIQLLNYYYIFLLFVSTTLLDWNIVNVRRCAPIRESTARFGHVPADRHQAALLRVHRYLASWIFAHQLYENRKYFSYDMIREKSVEASPAKAMSYENRLNVRDESYFSLLFHLLVQEKSGVVFPRLFDGKDVQRASALYTMSREKGGERKFHWCLNSIAISLEKLQLKTSGTMVRGNDVRVTMTFRWEPMT